MPTTMFSDILYLNMGIICHQVNCRGVMGKGLALDLRKRYPKVYSDYLAAYKAGHLQLGNVVMSKIKKGLYVASICGQTNYGANKKKMYTDYRALEYGLNKVEKFSNDNSLRPIYVPHGIGCGLANGDWKIVEKIVHNSSRNVIVVKQHL